MNAATGDIATKKMLYHYIGVYSDASKESEELAMMTINTLQKDCKCEDATIRGLAIRSMTSLRSKSLAEYLIECVKEGLRDPHPYARKAACLGCLKVYRLCFCSGASSSEGGGKGDDVLSGLFMESGILATVEKLLLEDRDANVVANALVTVVEIFGESDERLQNAALLTALTNKIRDFGELSQHLVLKLTYNYAVLANDDDDDGKEEDTKKKSGRKVPPLPDDVKYQWMNSLESRISSPNSSIALAASRIFLELTKNDPSTHQRVYERIKPSLLTLATAQTCGVETSAVVWAHLKLLAYRAPIAFVTDYKSFYVRVNADSFEIKRCKLRTLSLIADAQNCAKIVDELFEYVNDVQDEHFARLAMKAIGRVARKKKESFAMMNAEKRLMVTNKICEMFLETTSPSSKADSLIEIGLCLRQCHRDGEEEEETKECRSICCRAIESALEAVQFSVPDMFPQTQSSVVVSSATTKSITRARSMLLWLLGEFGASGFIDCAPYALESSIENLPEEVYPSIRTETFFASLKLFSKRAPEMRKAFETCLKWCATEDPDPSARVTASVYGSLMCSSSSGKIANDLLLARGKSKSMMQFSEEVEEQERFDRLFEEMDTLAITYELEVKKFIDGSLVKTEEDEEEANRQRAQQRQQQLDQETSLLQFDDFEAADDEEREASTSLNPNPVLDPSQFQLNWQLFPEVAKEQSAMISRSITQSTSSVIDRLKSNGFATAASGGDAMQMKFYVYAQTTTSKWYLIECVADVATNKCDWTMKSDSADRAEVDAVASQFNSSLL